MSKIIIGIHGLGNKPPQKLLYKWWKSAIHEGLNHINKPHPFLRFELVYWADLLHPHPEDPNIKDPENPLFLREPYVKAEDWKVKKVDQSRKKIQKFIEDQIEKLFVNEDGTINFSSITDKIIHHYFKDLDLYYSNELIEGVNILTKDAIRDRLIKIIRKHQSKDIMLIGHSMGTIIAYDVLLNYVDDLFIDTLVTVGSPLGLPIIRGKILKEKPNQVQLSVPDNVKNHWYNFSDLRDRVAFDFSLADDYLPSKKKIGITDFEVNNNYVINGKINPHKVYGYLRTPQLAIVIDQFLVDGRSVVWKWFAKQINKMFFH